MANVHLTSYWIIHGPGQMALSVLQVLLLQLTLSVLHIFLFWEIGFRI